MDSQLSNNGPGLYAFVTGPGMGYVVKSGEYAHRDGAGFELKMPKGAKNSLPRRVKMDEVVTEMVALHGEPSTWIERSIGYVPELNSEDEQEGVSMATYFMKSPKAGPRSQRSTPFDE